MKNSSYSIEMKNITMAFGTFKANDNINLIIERGEIHALIGENGAGKSTLMSVLFGFYKQTSGTISVNGKLVNIDSPLKANQLGIGMVHQHFKLVDDFTVMENILLNKEEVKHKIFIDYSDSRKKIEEIMDTYHFVIDLDKKVEDCTVAEQQRIEILKMLYSDSEILIFDEPTAVLSPLQIEKFLIALLDLKSKGKTIILISHKLDELKKVADRGTVIRKGKYVGTVSIKSTPKEKISEMMVGGHLEHIKKNDLNKFGETILEVKNVSIKRQDKPELMAIKNFDLKVREGEIVSIVGVEGNGQTELINAITGLQPIEEGEILFLSTEYFQKSKNGNKRLSNGPDILQKLNSKLKKLDDKNDLKSKEKINALIKRKDNISINNEYIDFAKLSISKKYKKGLSHIPEDRHKYGMVLDFDLPNNFILHDFSKYSQRGLLKYKKIEEDTEEIMLDFDVRSSTGKSSLARSLSGGNQQKFIVGREITRDSKLIVIAQPTRGLDVGAINNIHSYIFEARDMGKAILLLSYELDEVLNLSDKMIILNNGEKVGELNHKEATKNKLGKLMATTNIGAQEGNNENKN